MSLLPQRTSPGQRLALLGVVASMLFAVPVVRVLDGLDSALDEVRAQASGLDPMRKAVELQRDLHAHRQLSDRMLKGDQTIEPQRVARQADVDAGLVDLDEQLQRLAMPRARHEVALMQADWPPLSQRVQAQRIEPAESHLAHTLLVEQTLQVIDLVTESSRLAVLDAPGGRELARMLGSHLPRWADTAARLDEARHAGDAEAVHRLALLAKRQHERLLASFDHLQGASAALAALRPELVASAHAYPAGFHEQLHDATLVELALRLHARQHELSTERAGWLLALSLLGLVATGGCVVAWRQAPAPAARAGVDADASGTDGAHPDRKLAVHLFERLGRSSTNAAADGATDKPTPLPGVNPREHH